MITRQLSLLCISLQFHGLLVAASFSTGRALTKLLRRQLRPRPPRTRSRSIRDHARPCASSISENLHRPKPQSNFLQMYRQVTTLAGCTYERAEIQAVRHARTHMHARTNTNTHTRTRRCTVQVLSGNGGIDPTCNIRCDTVCCLVCTSDHRG